MLLALTLLLPPLARAQNTSQQLAASSVLETVKKRGAIRIGMSTFVPWAMRDKNGELVGYETTAKRLAEDMGVKAESVPTAWDGIIPALLAGVHRDRRRNVDHPARNLTVNFTMPYANSGVHLGWPTGNWRLVSRRWRQQTRSGAGGAARRDAGHRRCC
ncbi:MAG: transporter substrate-binding domain-containing protein [Candidatus Competibacteraceae bacterium]